MPSATKFSKLGVPVGQLEHAAEERLKDARALLDAGRFATSIAYSVYSLEIELKVLVCRRLDLLSLPTAFQTHDLDDLLLLAGVSNLMKRVKRPRQLKRNWDELTDLPSVDQMRYSLNPGWDEVRAKRVLQLLSDPKNGVIPWRRKQALRMSRSR
jgi:HEPN domain-containing protein